jgi:nucleotide-binding universal stress UspA family protein
VKNILVPTDFSPNAENAFRVALELATMVKGKITLIHSYKLIQRAGSFIGIESMLKEDAEKDMQKLLQKHNGSISKDVTVNWKVVKGDAVSMISAYSEDLDIDLVVMGTQGSTGLKEIFIGSVTNSVINNTSIPVLAIPMDCKVTQFNHIALAVDGKAVTRPTVYNPILDLANIFNAKLSIVHVTKETSAKLEENLILFFKEIDPNFHIIKGDDISKSLREFTSEHKVNLMCLLKRDRGFIDNLFHKSQTSRNVFYINIPLLILREK